MEIRRTANCVCRCVAVIAMLLVSSTAFGQGLDSTPDVPLPAIEDETPVSPPELRPDPNSIAPPPFADSEPIDAPVLNDEPALNAEPVLDDAPALADSKDLPNVVADRSGVNDDSQRVPQPAIASSESGAFLDELFEGKGFLSDRKDLPKQIVIRVRLVEQVNTISIVNDQQVSEMKNVVAFRAETVALSDDLSPEQRLGVIIALQEESLATTHQALAAAKDEKERGRLLSKLRDLYTERFEIDTQYQDYKVRKIELRAAKLRADVDAREKALSEWVDAMVTLAKVRASGIETMPAPVPASSPAVVPGTLSPAGFAPIQAVAPQPGMSLPAPGFRPSAPSTSPIPSADRQPSFGSRSNRLESY